ncbi:bifunctional hydroxymethylpyrimidine kinase/phosphomethylpyrimidine kinase [Streptococcus caprae]|uniref:pyridoxal kinase n=1 Tax=Streptococcus caprae TaxID=1640501 RepID=A0ABV8CV24_9STRE
MTSDYILALSGNDIFSGGGLHADLATYTVNQQHGFLALTCMTAITENGFEVFPVDTALYQAQLQSLKKVPFSGIKLGLLPNVEVAEVSLAFVKEHAGIPIVLDPVLVCKETHDVEVSSLRAELLKFFPHVTIITPNLVEAELLSQQTIKTLDDMKAVAKLLHSYGVPNVVIKGGNRLSKTTAIDVFYDGETLKVFESPVLDKNNTGAGCTFASSIASNLVKGLIPLDAVREAKNFVYQAIQASNEYGVVQYANH